MLAALERGLHVFCEKPLCYSPQEIAEIIAARDKAGKVVQVGYMKRFDPSYRLALAIAARNGEDAALRVGSRSNDPDSWPFIHHFRTRFGTDVPQELIAATAAKRKAQAERAIGMPR